MVGLDLSSLTIWKILALDEPEQESFDLVAANLAVARMIPKLAHLEISKYVKVVEGWTRQFTQLLPGMEQRFKQSPKNWNNDIQLFRVVNLQGFLSHDIGLKYLEAHRNATSVHYTDPSDLFVNGVIDKREGTCANLAILHAAMCRKLGWPVSLAVAKSHILSRLEEGGKVYNIEATSAHSGSVMVENDAFYIQKFALPKIAIECGSDLRKLTMKEMLGLFLSLAGRHFVDTGQMELADSVFPLSRVLFPKYRHAYVNSMVPAINRGQYLFNSDEIGHPVSIFNDLAPRFTASMPTFAPQDAGQVKIQGQSFSVPAKPSKESVFASSQFINILKKM